MEPRISCRDLFKLLLADDDDILIVDCRGEKDWHRYEVQIPGALRLGLDELLSFADALPDDELIILVDCSPKGRESRRAWRLLRRRELDVVCLRGGLPAWLDEGYPTERHIPRAVQVAWSQALTTRGAPGQK